MARAKRHRRRPGARTTRGTPYHHGSLRQTLIDTALGMLEGGGEQAVNLREAARRAGVSSGAPFRHFDNKEALLIAVAEAAAADLTATMEAAGSRHDDPLDRFRAMGVEYVAWAAAHPASFALLHSPRTCGHDGGSHRLSLLEQEQRELLADLVRDVGEPASSDDSPELVILTAHALVYGLARLLVDGVFSREPVDATRARALALLVTGVLGRGLGAG